MAKIYRTRQSQADYISIHDYVAKDSPQNAAAILRLFDEKLHLLSNHPTLGLQRPELYLGVRSWIVNNFVLFYQAKEDGIILLRVLHASMDMSSRYFIGL